MHLFILVYARGVKIFMSKNDKISQYVIFELGSEIYAINIEHVQRIVDDERIRPVPNTSNEIKGIIDVKGKDVSSVSDSGIKDIATVIDLRIKFSIESDKIDEEPYIIITRIDDVIVGLVVDHVIDVIDIADGKLSGKVDETITGKTTDYIQSIYREDSNNEESDLYIILNTNKLLNIEEKKQIDNIEESNTTIVD